MPTQPGAGKAAPATIVAAARATAGDKWATLTPGSAVPTSERMEATAMLLYLSTAKGEVQIHEAELPTITNAELKEFRISRAELNRVFAEGVQLMQGRTPGDHVHPSAIETLDGKWEVHLHQYSELSDPLMHEPVAGRA